MKRRRKFPHKENEETKVCEWFFTSWCDFVCFASLREKRRRKIWAQRAPKQVAFKNLKMKKIVLLTLLSMFVLKLVAQHANEINSEKATIIHSDEITAAAKKGAGLAVADSVLRVVSIEGKYNVGISVVSRSKINGKTPQDAFVHNAVTEVYHIVDGNGILVIGGTLDSAQNLPAESPVVLKTTGPSSRGKGISGGKRYQVGPGDIIIIPPNTPHGFIDIKSNKIVYTLVRIDAERVLELKSQK